MKRIGLLSIMPVLFPILFAVSLNAKEIAGVSEVITILPDEIQLNAKLDTGADSSSIDARNIEYFTKDGKDWVRFKVPRTLDNKIYELEYPLAGTTRIVSRVPAEANKNRSYHKRPVINMEICIGDEQRVIEVNLFDRSNFKFPFLLGASGLKEFNFLVDVQENDLLPKQCVESALPYINYEHLYLILMLASIVIIGIFLFTYNKLKKR